MNTCYNALDRHIKSGHGEQLALIYDSPVSNTATQYTYRELLEQVKYRRFSAPRYSFVPNYRQATLGFNLLSKYTSNVRRTFETIFQKYIEIVESNLQSKQP